jgi:DinB family protein
MNESGNRATARSHVQMLTRRSMQLIERVERDATDEERIRKPAPDAWSLTEVTQHVALVAGGMLRTAHPAGRSGGPLDSAKSLLLATVLRSPLKIRAPVSAIVPRPGVSWSDARANVRKGLDAWSVFVDGDTFGQIAFRHPFVGSMSPVRTAKFLVDHFEHHMRQVDRIFAGL